MRNTIDIRYPLFLKIILNSEI